MKYFVTSDIHGFYSILRDSLRKAGYEEENSNHHLIIVGDMFDRGEDSDKVLKYLYRLYTEKKATIILGNHDTFLFDLYNRDYLRVAFNIKHNGFDKTLQALSGFPFCDLDRLDMIKEAILHNYPYLEDFLRGLPYYKELGDYIFVHGGIDGSLSDWKNTPEKRMVWNYQVKLEGVEGKTIVVGHHRVPTIRKPGVNYKALFESHPEDFDILHKEGKIFIDRYVEVSQELNVLILDIEV